MEDLIADIVISPSKPKAVSKLDGASNATKQETNLNPKIPFL
jgi:hypothetical protein